MAAGAIWVAGRQDAHPGTAAPAPAPPSASAPATAPAPNADEADAGKPHSHEQGWVMLSWGSGPKAIGRSPQGGAPSVGHTSLDVGPEGEVVLLDPLNGRILRLSAQGALKTPLPVTLQSARDLAMGGDGTLAVLDSTGDKAVALLAPDGSIRGELPLGESDARGVDIAGTEVLVALADGTWKQLGSVDGKPSVERKVLPGRPSRDGTAHLLADIIDGPGGRFSVRALDAQTGAIRFQRELRTDANLESLSLLDTDDRGTVYVSVSGRAPNPNSGMQEGKVTKLFCLALTDGRPLGFTSLPVTTVPDESIRELAVDPDGGVLHAQKTDEGFTLRKLGCR